MAEIQDENYSMKQMLGPGLSLFASVSTLLCCALPALLVTLGAGATLASIVSATPWLVAFSKYKIWTFSISGGMIVLAGIMRYRAKDLPCPADKQQAALCLRLRTISRLVYIGSIIIWAIGFFFAFIAVHLLN